MMRLSNHNRPISNLKSQISTCSKDYGIKASSRTIFCSDFVPLVSAFGVK